MSLRHPSAGIAFEPLTTLAAGLVGALLTVAAATLALRRAFYPARPKETP